MQLPSTLDEHQEALDRGLREALQNGTPAGLYHMMHYQLGWVARDGTETDGLLRDRWIGALCLEAAQSLDPGATPVAAAVATELLYASVAVHEELENAELASGGREPVWAIWGPAQAINVGDGLHALARLAVLGGHGTGEPAERALTAVHTLDETALRYYEAHYTELALQERIDVTVEQYRTVHAAKRGALVGGAMALGALAAGALPPTAAAFRLSGERLGLAMQIAEDIVALWGELPVGRVLSKTKLYPVVYALEHATVPQKRALGEVYFKRVMEPADIERVRNVLDTLQARDHAQAAARTLLDEGIGALAGAGLSAAAQGRWNEIFAALGEARDGRGEEER